MLVKSIVSMSRTRTYSQQATSLYLWEFSVSRNSSLSQCKDMMKQVAQLSQRDRAAGWVSYGQKWKIGTGRQYLRTIYVYIQRLRRIWPAK